MKVKVNNINIIILKQIKEKYPDLWRSAESKFPHLDDWINGNDYPTYNQLVELSKVFHIPYGYFFLQKLPDYQRLPIPHFRTHDEQTEFKPSAELRDTVLFAQKVQEWAKDILIELGYEPFPFCGKHSLKSDKNLIINELKKILNIEDNWASQMRNWTEAFTYLKKRTEEIGIIVLINGVVGNNIRRKLSVDEFRGFVLYDNIAPVIFINNNDAISAKIFTLIHEIVHLLIGQSASFDLRWLQSADNDIEKFCDECTAEFLVPENQLKIQYHQQKDIGQLAKHFKVSRIVILRRLLDINAIDKNMFLTEYNNLYKTEIKGTQTEGGDFYRIEMNRLSKKFLGLLQSAINHHIIQYRDALRVTNLKPKTFEKLLLYPL